MDERLIALITEEVIRQLSQNGNFSLPGNGSGVSGSGDCGQNCRFPAGGFSGGNATDVAITEDICSPQAKAKTLLRNPADQDALQRMKNRTTARIGIGACGARENTRTVLTLRADHASARDAVMKAVDPELLQRMGLFEIASQCQDKNIFITRPDLGRKLCPESVKLLQEKCEKNPDVQIYIADGLSSTSVLANAERILPILQEGLNAKGLKVGTPFYMKYGRVAAEDEIAEILGAKVVCVLLGERPGLATAESMSAYIVYNAHVGIPEAKRTVVSNIHKSGLSAVEAGAYIVEVLEQILEKKASGVDLVK